MDDKRRKFIGEAWVKLYDSLLESVDEAGGAIDYYRYDKLQTMTVPNFFNKIATNKIRFIYIGKRKEN